MNLRLIFYRNYRYEASVKKTEELSSQTENLDKTRHNKIFVLDENIEQIKAQEKVLHNIKNLKNELYDRNPTKIRNLLTSILNEYNRD